MDRSNYFDFIIEGNDLDPTAIKEDVGLPCEIYYKGQVSKNNLVEKDIISESTRWIYGAKSRRNVKTETFLTKQLEIISQKMLLLEKYIKKHTAFIEITLYEDDLQNEKILLTTKILKLFNEIGVEVQISFVNAVAIYGEERIAKVANRIYKNQNI